MLTMVLNTSPCRDDLESLGYTLIMVRHVTNKIEVSLDFLASEDNAAIKFATEDNHSEAYKDTQECHVKRP